MSEIGPNLSEVAKAAPKPPAPKPVTNTGAVKGAEALEETTASPEQEQRQIAVKIVSHARQKGVFANPQARSAAEFATQNEGQDTKALLAALRIVGAYVSDGSADLPRVANSYNVLSETFEIVSDGNTYKLSDLEIERVNPNTTEGRRAEIDKIIAEGLKTELTPKEMADQTLGSEIDSLQRQIKERKENKQEIKDYEEILRALKIAQTVEGDGRAFFQISALRRLRASGLSQDPVNLGQAIDGSGEIFAKSQQAIKSNAIDQGYTPEQAELIVDSLRRGDFTDLQRMGFFERPGVDRLIFGKELTDREMAERLALVLPGEAGRKFGKDEGLMILLMALVGVTQATRQAVMGEFRR